MLKLNHIEHNIIKTFIFKGIFYIYYICKLYINIVSITFKVQIENVPVVDPFKIIDEQFIFIYVTLEYNVKHKVE
jgi:hypothetical protein